MKSGHDRTSPARLRTTLGEGWRRLRGGELNPLRAAASIAIGLFIGVTPLWGVHFLLVLAVCLPLRLDAALAYLASNISLPFIAPFLSFAEVEIGTRVLTGAWLPVLSTEAMRTHGITPFFKEIAVGTAIFAPAIATLGGSITYVLARAVRRVAIEGLDPAFTAVADRYARGRKGTRIYVMSKLKHDPVVRTVREMAIEAGLGEVVDIGCGRGQLGLVLIEAKSATKLVGMDWDQEKVDEATRASEGLAASFERADIRFAEIPACDTALLIDVLHYFSDEEQDTILTHVADAARRRVVIRDLDPDRGWRSTLTRIQEAITTSVRFNRGARLNVRPIARMEAVLESHGFRVEVTPCWEGTPFANVLVVASREGRR